MNFSIKSACSLITLCLLLASGQHVDAQQDMDMSMSIPQKMVVDGVNPAAGTVRLNGREFRLADDPKRVEGMNEQFGTPLALSQIRPGMEVIAVTEAGGSGGNIAGIVFALWRSP